ncbi:MAG: hypothetical protein JWQ76_548 [Ramlibacter sp.]|nr:hypothetical protein [Ramlibacter sp.]
MHHPVTRRQWLSASVAAAALLQAGVLRAETYPSRPVRIVVPFAPGGGADTWSRIIGQRLSEELHQPVVMDSRPGASGVIGSRYVARSAPADGYTLLFGTGTNITLGPLAMKSPGFDFEQDLAPVAGLSLQPLFIAVPADSPFRTLAELVEAGRKEGNKLSFGSTGMGSLTHVAGLVLNKSAQTSLLHVPYKGGAPLGLALLTAEVSCSFIIGNDAMPHVKAGKIRLLGVTAARRSPFSPQVPTMREAGLADFPDLAAWFAFFVRAGTPADIVDLLNRRIVRYVAEPANQARLEQTMAEPWTASPGELMAALRQEAQSLGPILKAAGIALD